MCKAILKLMSILICFVLFCCVLCLLKNAFYAYTQESTLVKWYYIGGIISGVFAFGAFIVALISNNSQRRTSDLQRFESTFFNMLAQQQQITSELSFSYSYKDTILEDAPTETYTRLQKEIIVNKEVKGRELFYFLFATNNKYLCGMKFFLDHKGMDAYEESMYPTYFDHYFRHLYTIVKFVNETKVLSPDDKYKYTSMVRATLSRYELIWLYYNSLSQYGKDKFKDLIEDYSLLKNIRVELLTASKEFTDTLLKNGITENALKEQGFSFTDYEYRLSDEKGNKAKYYIGAFYNKKELINGRKIVMEWEKYMDKMTKKGNNIDLQMAVQTSSPIAEFNDDDDDDDFICAFI